MGAYKKGGLGDNEMRGRDKLDDWMVVWGCGGMRIPEME